MAAQVHFESAYVLHARAYRETSLLVDFFSFEKGRVTAVAKGVRRKNSPQKSLLQPFNGLVVRLVGKRELKTLADIEHQGTVYRYQGDVLLSGLYLNELLYRLLPPHDPHAELFLKYQITLESLNVGISVEVALRLFEKELLSELGYGLSLVTEAGSENAILPESYYTFHPSHGLSLCQPDSLSAEKPMLFLGEHLLKFAKGFLSDSDTLLAAKRLMRLAIADILGKKPLYSKQLFGYRQAERVENG